MSNDLGSYTNRDAAEKLSRIYLEKGVSVKKIPKAYLQKIIADSRHKRQESAGVINASFHRKAA